MASAEGGAYTVLPYINAFDLKMQDFVCSLQAGRQTMYKKEIRPSDNIAGSVKQF